MTILTISCLISIITVSIIFYSGVGYIRNLYSSIYLPTSTLSEQHSKAIILKQDKPIPRRGLTIFDRNIQYHDFNYLNSDSLTYDNRTYAEDLQILYRFPKKRSINSLLLIFHGCGRSARDWFHTIERQRIIGAAIDLGYACLAFQASDPMSHCWSNEIDIRTNEDVQMVWKGLENFYKEYPRLGKLKLQIHRESLSLFFFSLRIFTTFYIRCIEWWNIFKYLRYQSTLQNSRTNIIHLHCSFRGIRTLCQRKKLSTNSLDLCT
jgi:hypothetical protein